MKDKLDDVLAHSVRFNVQKNIENVKIEQK